MRRDVQCIEFQHKVKDQNSTVSLSLSIRSLGLCGIPLKPVHLNEEQLPSIPLEPHTRQGYKNKLHTDSMLR